MMRKARMTVTVAGLVACCLIHAAAVAFPPAAVCGRAFVLADRGYAAPFFLGQDDPVSARSAVDALIREVKARSGATLKPFAVQSNPKAGYSVSRCGSTTRWRTWNGTDAGRTRTMWTGTRALSSAVTVRR